MPAHIRPLKVPLCLRCDRKATVEVWNTRNAPIGYYCKPCGQRKAREMNEAGALA